MARSRELKVVLTGDPSSLNRAFAKAGSGADKMGSRVSGAAKLAGAALGGALVLGAKSAVDAFGEAEKVAAQTQATLKSTGGVAKVTAKDIGDLATAISRKSGIDDEAIQSGANLLLTFTKIRNEVGAGNAIFDRATQTVADFSVTFKKDLTGSAILVGKALNDPVKGLSALSRVGVQFTKQQKEQITTLVDSGRTLDAQKVILKELEVQTKGAAAAYGDTLPGKIDKAKNSMGNLAEAVGGTLAPAIASAADGMTSFVLSLTTSDRPARFFSAIGDQARSVQEAIGGLIFRFRQFREGGDSIAAALGKTFTNAVSRVNWSAVGDTISTGFTKGADFTGKLAPAVATGISTALGQINGRDLLSGLLRVVSESINALFSPSFWIDNFAAIFSTVTIAIPVAKILKIPGADFLFRHISKPIFGAVGKLASGLAGLFGKMGSAGVTGFLASLERLAPRTANVLLALVTGSGKWLRGLPGKFKGAALGAIGSMTDGITRGAGRVGGAVGSLTGKIISSLGKAASSMFRAGWDIAKSILNGIVRGIGKGIGAVPNAIRRGIGSVGSFLGSIVGRNSGGIIPGQGNTDTVPAMLTPGEFVIRKRVVEKFGPTFFAAINDGKRPQRFTGGGIVARANKLDGMRIPYLYGGGHGTRDGFNKSGMDCSASVSYALGVSPRVSGQFMSFGRPGPGSPNDTKIYANPGHMFAVFNGRGWGTSRENPGGGPGWLSYNHRTGFTIRHLEDGSEKGSASTVGDPQETVESGKQRKRERAERSGSRAVNRIAAKFGRGLSTAVRGAAAVGQVVEQAEGGYGRSERFFGQVIGGQAGVFGDEDLNTPEGRAQRTTEVQELKKLKQQQLARLNKRKGLLKRAISKASKQLSELRKARDRAKGAKRAKMSERIRAFDDRLVDLKAELAALGEQISDTTLDIGDLDKDLGELAQAPEAEAGPSTTDKLGQALGDIDLQERAGILTPEQARAARIATLTAARDGAFGALSQRELWEVLGQLREAADAQAQATVDNTSALRDLKASIDAQLAFADRVSAVTSFEAVRAMADVMSGQLGARVQARSQLPGSGALSRL